MVFKDRAVRNRIATDNADSNANLCKAACNLQYDKIICHIAGLGELTIFQE